MSTIAIIGAGNIGEALISGLVAAGHDPKSVIATNRTPSRSKYLENEYGIRTTDDNHAAVSGADYVFVCVKPPQVVSVLSELADTIDKNDSTVVASLAAGVKIADMEEAVSAGTPVIRIMANTPMIVGAGMNACTPGRYVSDQQMDEVAEVLSAVGDVVVVKEDQMDAVVAVSGSAPAYYFLFTEALIDAGVQAGLPRDLALKLAKSTVAGAGALLSQRDDEPATLRANISSPGGSTVAALRELEESGIRGAVFRAVEACARRSNELGG
ncbi:pyrroline-5-carboxylate reductase [Corynebacterium yudongzhengii]|uniref:Pyrroline-5-carboxylate reductase n=1 Tax=Corynebacterium yudongzhengii TaxID=2080740 RepID=A0A2U1T9J8_9CORY|nr:pyrroline-5-carboxylate reductase [Corynebacterium yudongzhengii]AWB81155.1 pyrroline-5-carboxylate reductase [Corynebacterium yudongzhengii]PWC02694.1 pyrroline-5-carboxylate reductase [Corynebacterium yudongzhengii]